MFAKLCSRLFPVFILGVLVLTGCGDPKLYPIEGKVTLGGKSYERLLVYLRPIGKPADSFTLGVGETDVKGVLGLRSTAGDGLAKGEYRVSFSCLRMGNSKEQIGLGEKADDNPNVKTFELVPARFVHGTEEYEDADSPVTFEITSSENNFEFDIPLK